MKTKIFRQFYDQNHRQYRYFFVDMTKTRSRYKYNNDLFGGLYNCRLFCNNFKLELVYGET